MRTLLRRMPLMLTVVLAIVVGGLWSGWRQTVSPPSASQSTGGAMAALLQLPVKGRAPKTGYARTLFGNGWAMVGSCDMREHILVRDLQPVITKSVTNCTVKSGTLQDPYTAQTIQFVRGPSTSSAVQIDHVVALGDAWQKGAQQLSTAEREQLYNDPLELIAVDGPANQQKSDADAASWLPANKAYRCRYVARQIAVKQKYRLWVTAAERDAMSRVLDGCPGQELPAEMPHNTP